MGPLTELNQKASSLLKNGQNQQVIEFCTEIINQYGFQPIDVQTFYMYRGYANANLSNNELAMKDLKQCLAYIEEAMVSNPMYAMLLEGTKANVQEKLSALKSNNMEQLYNTDGHTYNTIKIGSQEWFTENLNVSHFINGDPIPEAKSDEEWEQAGRNDQPAWCYYDNDPENGKIYGKLYNWFAINDPRGLAPAGWHVPTDAEWTELTDYLGGIYIAGGKLKETGTGHWMSPNTGASNESGFTGLPGGGRLSNGTFFSIGVDGYWWSSTEYSSSSAGTRYLYYGNGFVTVNYYSKHYGIGIRCLRD